MFIDLNQFKALNDTMGHDVGDLLLQQVANRLTDCSREIDTVARLGGDEFVLLINNLSQDATEAETKAGIVNQKIFNALSQTYDLDGYQYKSTPSIGISILHPDEGTETDILKKADTAMYKVKIANQKIRHSN